MASLYDITEGLNGDKVTLVKEHETARSPSPPVYFDGSGQYIHKKIQGPLSSVDLTTFTDLKVPIYLPGQWHADLFDAMVKVYRKGVLQDRDTELRIDSYTISADGTTITPAEALTAGEYLKIYIWRYI